ncbi:MAG: molybdate ABC transporter substrate-binding protein [Rhodoferax sp.]|nr:molybdate ABC transporter substrate-binding protein [Rhodoferax sp.]
MNPFKPIAAVCALLQLIACSTEGPRMASPAPTAAIAVFAAGSLRQALTEIADSYQARTGQPLALTFGASGLLRERIEKGEQAQLFASADTEHPQRLAAAGQWQTPRALVQNSLCALSTAHIRATPDTLLQTLLRPDVRVGTSTPQSDPAGDYAWALFRKAEALQPGAYALLDAKALKLTGAADSPRAPQGRGFYGWAMDTEQADVFLTYCTNALAAQKEVPRLQVLALPAALQVGAPYAFTVLKTASPQAQAFADALLLPAARQVFARYGFAAP